MLQPRFTLRFLMGIMVVIAIVFSLDVLVSKRAKELVNQITSDNMTLETSEGFWKGKRVQITDVVFNDITTLTDRISFRLVLSIDYRAHVWVGRSSTTYHCKSSSNVSLSGTTLKNVDRVFVLSIN